MCEACSGWAYDKGQTQCRDGDKRTEPASLPSWARLPINRCNLPAVILGSLRYQLHPAPLLLDGVRDLHRDFLDGIVGEPEAAARLAGFHAYMRQSFRLDAPEDAGLSPATQRRRERLDYRRLIRGWHFNADSIEGAVLKGWVESRFGLLPRYHRAPIRDFSGEAYRLYLEQRATGLYNTNALEAQLDLVYSFTQLELARRHAQASHLHLFRGVNRWEAHEVLGRRGEESLLLLNNVNAFSTDAERAGEFGDHLFETLMPLSKVICCAEVMPDSLQGEGEVLALGGVCRVRRR